MEDWKSVTCYTRPPGTSSGVWAGGRPWNGTGPLLMLQISLIVVTSYTFRRLLRPFRQPPILSQILTGMVLGPAGLSRLEFVRINIFNPKKIHNLKLIGTLGLIFYQFIVGVKIDVGRVLGAPTTTIIIAACSFLAPIFAGIASYSVFRFRFAAPFNFDENTYVLVKVLYMCAPTSPIVVSSLLSELSLLNSKIGRLAIGCALVQTLLDAFLELLGSLLTNVMLARTTAEYWQAPIAYGATAALVIYGFRPVGMWVVRRTPKGRPISDNNFLVLLALTLAVCFVCALIGHPMPAGAFYMGLALPTGPPLGSTFVDRLEAIASVLFFPAFVTLAGIQTDLSSLPRIIAEDYYLGALLHVDLILLAVKLVFTALPAFYCGMTPREALTLAVILNARGITELARLLSWIDELPSSSMLQTLQLGFIVVMAAVTMPLAMAIYTPEQVYMVYKRRTVQNSRESSEMRVVTCVHDVESVPSSINLLEAMCNEATPIAVYLLHLLHLVGRLDGVLVQYHSGKENQQATGDTDRIVKAFLYLEHMRAPAIKVIPYIDISPYASMYEDVCSMALESKASLILLPFHVPAIRSGGTADFESMGIRRVILNILDHAPCSAAILVHHDHVGYTDVALSNVIRRVVVYFCGGADDREAVAIAMHLAANNRVAAVVVHFTRSVGDSEAADSYEGPMDKEILDEFMAASERNPAGLVYRQEVVKDGEEMFGAMLSISGGFDLLVIGRMSGDSSLTDVLSRWSEYPELGIVGGMLALSDVTKSVLKLVVQHHPTRRRRS